MRLLFRWMVGCVVAVGTLLRLGATNIEVGVETAEHRTVATVVERKVAPRECIFDVKLKNPGGESVSLAAISIRLNPDSAIPVGTRYMIGADAQEPDGHMEQLVTGQPAKNDHSNMYVLFRRSESDFLLVGVISWRTFLCDVSAAGGAIRIVGDGDHRRLGGGESIGFERIVSIEGPSWQDLLDRYATLIAEENRVATPPDVEWRGWSTWDYYTRNFTTEDVEENLQAMRRLEVPMNMIQLDGGWWKERGDYLETRDGIRGGIKFIAERVHGLGLKVGLHFDGFRASKSAVIVKEHPEYFLHTEEGDLLEIKTNGRETFFVWDYSHPGALDYIRAVMRHAREAWRVDYFKIDFMRNGLTQGRSYRPLTSVERFRMALRAMREGMGPDAYFLACGANFGPVIGLVDGNRTGQDIHPDYHTVRSKVKHTSGSYYLHRRVFNTDPDYIVLRSQHETDTPERGRASLTLQQAEMWANYVSIYGNARFESDKVALLSDEKKALVRQSFTMPFFDKTIPLDLWDHYKSEIDAPGVFLAKGRQGEICLGLFNWDDGELEYDITGFAADDRFEDFGGSPRVTSERGSARIALPGTRSLLLRYRGNLSFEQLRARLTVSERPTQR